VATASREELRREFLELLREDEEFRLAVAGLIGLSEILAELRRLREDFSKRFEALERKMIEHDKRFEVLEKKLLEHDKRFEAIERKLLEHDKRFEAIERKLLEHDRRFEAIERRLEEHDRKFNEILEEIKKIWLRLEEHNRRISNVEMILGALTESFYSKALLDDLREELKAKGERIVARIRNARVDESDIDLLVETDRTVYVAEVKVRPRHEDVGSLIAKRDLVAERFPGKRVVAVLAGALIGREVEEYARQRGVEVYRY